MKESEGQRRWGHFQESRLKGYGHVLRGEEESIRRQESDGGRGAVKRRRGTPTNLRWLDNIKNDLSERELSGEEAKDRVQWRRLIRNIDPT